MTIKYPGKEIEIGGEKRVFAPLNAAASKQYRNEIKNVFVGQIPDIELVSKLAFCSLQRNYPDITLEQAEEMVDYSNIFDVWEAVMNVSGLAVQAGKLVQRMTEEMESAGLKMPSPT